MGQISNDIFSDGYSEGEHQAWLCLEVKGDCEDEERNHTDKHARFEQEPHVTERDEILSDVDYDRRGHKVHDQKEQEINRQALLLQC